MIRKLLYDRSTGISIILILTFLTGCKPNLDIDTGPEPTRDPVLEASIIEELETHNPEAVSLYQEATQTGDDMDYEKAYILYEQLADLVPEFSVVYRRLSYIEYIRGNHTAAIELARKAIDLDPNPYNKSALAIVLLEVGTPNASREAFNLATSAVEEIPDDVQAVYILMISAWLANEEDVLRHSNERLLELAPGEPLSHYIAGMLAASDGKWFKAERELLISEKLGIPPEAIQEVMDSGLSWNLRFFRSLIWGAVATGIWLAGLGLLYLIGKYLSRTTIEALKKESSSFNTKLSNRERDLRSAYRWVIRILSYYFYLSIPFVILTVLVLTGLAYYIFSLIGSIPIYIIYIAGFIGVVLLISLVIMLQSLTKRVKDTPPGILLERDRVPQLWSLNDDIARKLDIRSVDAIYLTPDPAIAVNETGKLVKKMRGDGVRNLILGMGVLSGLSQGQFAAVLAHEYGHFSNQDTAGGNLASRVYGSLEEMTRHLAGGIAAKPFNPVWLFVIAYSRIYFSVTLGAKRLQEVQADRYAALAMGSDIVIDGLTNIVKESILFTLKANYEIKRSLEEKIGLTNLYNLPMNEHIRKGFEKKYDERMEEKPSDFASHPALQERIDRITSYRISDKPIPHGDQPLLDLIPDVEELQKKMTLEITDQIPGL